MKYKSAKGTVINIPEGLTPQQVRAIKADADAGYGTRAQQTASQLGKGKGSTGTPPARTVDQQIARTQAAIAKKNAAGQKVTPGLTARLGQLQGGTTPNPDTPGSPTVPGGMTDPLKDQNTDKGTKGLGDTATTIDNFLEGLFTNLKPLDLSGAPKVLTAQDLAAQRQQTQDSLYNEDTKYLERNRTRDLEASKQELANRGIPYSPDQAFDPNSQDLYGRTIGKINEGYQGQQQSALDRARSGADARMASEAAVNQSARNSFVDSATKSYQSQLDAATTGGSVLQELMTKYGIDAATAQAKIDARIKKYAVDHQKTGPGRVGGSSGDAGGGFEVVG